MRICGIVSEYNPFHNGHRYHIEKTRAALGEDCAIVCCMSGDFVQRGEPALMPKNIRAESAVLSGADLVIELPVDFCLRSAEGFARGAVYILSAMEVVTDISFGAETADIHSLSEIAEVLAEHETVAQTLRQMETGISYAAAREKALFSIIKEKAEIIQKPNNILAVEYLKALRHYSSKIKPMAVERFGAMHDSYEPGTQDIASASFIRQELRHGNDVKPLMNKESYELLSHCIKEGMALTGFDRLDLLMKAAFAKMTKADFENLPDMTTDLAARLYDAAQKGRAFEEIAMIAKTKRYAHSRIRRALIAGLLGLSRTDMSLPPAYARVLAFNERGQEVLALCREHTSIPVITKPAHVKKLSARAVEAFELGSRAADIYNLCLPNGERRFGADWKFTPIRL